MAEEDRENVSPYEKASALSKITYWWMIGLFTKAYKKQLRQEDVYAPLDYITSEYNIQRFQGKWENLREGNVNKEGSLFWLLVKHYKCQILTGYVVYLTGDMSRFCLFLTLRYFVETLEGGEEKSISSTSWGLFGVVVVLAFISAFTTCHGFRMVQVVELRIKVLLGTLVYMKVLKLSNKSFQECTSGKIVNLMSADIETFNMGLTFLYGWFSAPFICSAVFIYGGLDIGPSPLVGIGLLIIVVVIQYYIGNAAGKIRVKQAQWTDKLVLLMNEIIKAMKVIKMYCWEKAFAEIASNLRKCEMKVQLVRSLMVAFQVLLGYPVIKLMIYLIVLCHILTGNELSFMQSISLIGIFRMLEISFFRFFSSSFFSVKEMIASSERVKTFLLMEEKKEHLENKPTSSSPGIKMTDFGSRWPNESPGNDNHFHLRDIHFNAKKGDSFAVVGKVGSGKSTLLMAILNELQPIKGQCQVEGSIAYAPQEPWILSETVRDNILMGEEYNKERYEAAVRACALDEDLNGFPEGDHTMVGERGLTLSGGQKARLGLARTVYQDADIYLLDDPLSAVDGKVGNIVFFECLNGFLRGKVRILVTHHLHYLPHIDNILVLQEGKMIASGKFKEVAETLKENIEVENKNEMSALSKPLVDNSDQQSCVKGRASSKMKKEDRNEEGGVNKMVYLKYVKAGSGVFLLPLFLVLFMSAMGAGVFHDWLLVHWAKGYKSDNDTSTVLNNTFLQWFNPSVVYDDVWYVKFLGVLIVANFVTYMLAFIVLMCLCTIAGYNLYNQMFFRLLKAPSWFFETNPVGQILNRFSRDTAFMDIYLIIPLLIAFGDAGPSLPDVVYVVIINPWCILPILIYLVILRVLYSLLVPGMRESKRIEASMRSPVYSHLSATIEGLTVIRAMKKEELFLDKAKKLMDLHSSAWFCHLSSHRGVNFLVDLLSIFLVAASFIIMLTAFDKGVDDVGSVGLAFMYLPGILLNITQGFVYIGHVEIMMTSVERIYQYSKLEQEAPDHEEYRPPPDWPQKGEISFQDVYLYYRGQPTPALGPLNINIKAGEKIGVVGRTGAGKSSLFVCLLRMVEPKGTIMIDGTNVLKIGLSDFRSCFSVIPQDPVLFNQSLRHNLDPLKEYGDDDLWEVLDKVQLKTKVKDLPGQMEARMGESGSNFSVGEKQLLCLARAVLRKNKIVLIDEATANVDNRTDAVIQKTLHESLSEATVITIAHRLNTLIATDRIMVLKEGRVVEMDHPYKLLQQETGAFYDMVKILGQENLEFFKEATKENMDQKFYR